MANNNFYTTTSPYYFTEIVEQKYLDIMQNRPIPSQVSDVLLKLPKVYEYRPDLLAFDLYSDARLWWVFAQRNPNKLKDPYFDFVTDIEIYIPKLDYLKQILGF
jgi:hypothetical protein